MTFEDFKNKADALVDFYGLTPPDELLEHGNVFSDRLSLANITQALYRELDQLAKPYLAALPEDELLPDELLDYLGTIEKRLREKYYNW